MFVFHKLQLNVLQGSRSHAQAANMMFVLISETCKMKARGYDRILQIGLYPQFEKEWTNQSFEGGIKIVDGIILLS